MSSMNDENILVQNLVFLCHGLYVYPLTIIPSICSTNSAVPGFFEPSLALTDTSFSCLNDSWSILGHFFTHRIHDLPP
jgi:hypothetical protein